MSSPEPKPSPVSQPKARPVQTAASPYLKISRTGTPAASAGTPKEKHMAKMKITCPKSKRHKRFSVTAHVVQEWVVDEKSEWQRTTVDCLEVTHRPDRDDRFVCITCGAEAKVEAV